MTWSNSKHIFLSLIQHFPTLKVAWFSPTGENGILWAGVNRCRGGVCNDCMMHLSPLLPLSSFPFCLHSFPPPPQTYAVRKGLRSCTSQKFTHAPLTAQTALRYEHWLTVMDFKWFEWMKSHINCNWFCASHIYLFSLDEKAHHVCMKDD